MTKYLYGSGLGSTVTVSSDETLCWSGNAASSGLPLRVCLLIPDVFSAAWVRVASLETSFVRLEADKGLGFLLVVLIAYQMRSILLVTTRQQLFNLN